MGDIKDTAKQPSSPAQRSRLSHPPTRLLDAVQDTERDERVELVEALEGKDGDVHTAMALSLAPA
jgi:hypothetical protein